MKYLNILSRFLILVLLVTSCQKEHPAIPGDPKQPVNPPGSLTNLGNEQWRMGNYEEALRYFKEAYAEVSTAGDEVQMATLLNNLGLVHWRLEHNDAAMECYAESAQLAEKLDFKRLLGLTYTNRALILKEQRDFQSAFTHNNKAIALFEALGDPRDLAIAYNNQGQIYRYGNQLEPALKYYALSLGQCHKIDYFEGMATAYQNLSTVYTQKGEKSKAFASARKCLALSLRLDSKVRISEAYLELARNHERFGQPDSALLYYKKYHECETRLLEGNQSERLAQHEAHLGMAVKNLRIQNLQNEKKIAESRLWFIAGGIFIVLLTAAFFVYRYLSRMRFNKRRLELDLQTSQQLIGIKERELKTYIIDLSRKNAIINRLQGEPPGTGNESEVAELLGQKILTDEDWDTFKTRFNSIYPGFFSIIKDSGGTLTEAEIRILVLMRLGLNGKDMADILGISPQSVRVCKMRLKKKLLAKGFESVEVFLSEAIK